VPLVLGQNKIDEMMCVTLADFVIGRQPIALIMYIVKYTHWHQSLVKRNDPTTAPAIA